MASGTHKGLKLAPLLAATLLAAGQAPYGINRRVPRKSQTARHRRPDRKRNKIAAASRKRNRR